jgi:Ca-activated chloride channel family protein
MDVLSDWQLARDWALWLLLLPLLVVLLPRLKRPMVAPVLPQFAGLAQTRVERWRFAPGFFPAALAWGLLVLAAAQPQQLGEPVALPKAGRDMMLAVDLSGSMEVRDMRLGSQAVNRLRAVQAVANDFIEQRRGDRLGLILFGSEAFLQTPLTFDVDTVRTHLLESSIGLPGRSTAIGDAIALAVRYFRQANDGAEDESSATSDRVLVLLTDGQNNAGAFSVDDALALAEADEVVIYTIGFGSRTAELRARNTPELRIDEEALREVAERTGGQYFRAERTGELAEIYDRLNELEPVDREQDVVRPWQERYRWPLGLGLLLATMAWARVRQEAAS